MRRLALVASPFTGPAAWRATAAALADSVAIDYGGVSGPDWYGSAARRIAAAAGDGPRIAVLHSGAGGFAPALAEAGAAGLIFVDAVRPHPGRSLREVNAAFVEHLASRAADGRLPPWNRWFDQDPLPRLLPDPTVREAVAADLPQTLLAFLDAVPPPRTPGRPCRPPTSSSAPATPCRPTGPRPAVGLCGASICITSPWRPTRSRSQPPSASWRRA